MSVQQITRPVPPASKMSVLTHDSTVPSIYCGSLCIGLDGSYHPESGGTLMGAAASVAKNLASHNSGSAAADGDAPTDSNSLPTADSSSVVDPSENGDNPPATNGESSHEHDANSASNGRVDGEPSAQGKSTRKADGSGSTRRPSVPPSSGGGGSAGNDWKAPGTGGGASSKAGSAAGGIEAMSGSTLDLSVSEKQRKKKSSESIYRGLSHFGVVVFMWCYLKYLLKYRWLAPVLRYQAAGFYVSPQHD